MVTIGHFDGLHRGHMALINSVCDRAGERGLVSVMVSFDPLATEFFKASDPPVRIYNFSERYRLLERTRLGLLWLLRFNSRMAATSADEFETMLVRALNPKVIVVGGDFRYGTGRAGDIDSLTDAGRRHGFEVIRQTQVKTLRGDERISSSMVRQSLLDGDLKGASRLLGRPYAMYGRVVRGQQLGRKLGYPTANILLHRRRSPLHGIYAVRVNGPGLDYHPGVASIGTRPTVDGKVMILEVHLLDYDGDLYGKHLETIMIEKLRDEEKYDDLDSLVIQIGKDVEAARRCLDGEET